MITLFTKMKELAALGELTWEQFYRPDIGMGERPLYKGSRTRTIANFVGNTKNIGNGDAIAVEFKEPHDLLVCETSGQVIAFAKS